MNYLGDFKTNAVVNVFFTTNAAAGGAVAPSSAFEAADVKLYKGSSATERTSQSGWTMTSPFDSITGQHVLAIDTSDNTDSGFYAAGNDYNGVLTPDTETVDSQTPVADIVVFSIQNRASSLGVAMTEAYASDGAAPTPEQMLFMIWAAVAEFAISGTTLTCKKLDGSTTAMTFTLDSASTPTSRTRAS